jgi:DUF971 family protein
MTAPDPTAPTEITVSRERREMLVRWGDGHESRYGFDLLRRECPCALCADQRSKPAPAASLTLLSGPVVRAGEVQATDVRPVGRYAVNFVWSDAHDAGIYSYNYLRQLCPCPTCRGSRAG